MHSLWSKIQDKNEFKSLNSNINTDILIIGGGICGVLCAYFLQKLGVKYVLVEAKKVGNGITKNTTAKITLQHGLIYDNLIKNFSLDIAYRYLKANQLALEKYKELCKSIDCDFEEKPAFTYSLENRLKVENEIKALEKLGCESTFESEIPLPFKISGAVKLSNQAQFHPLKFIHEISKDLNIYENTFINKIKNHTAFSEHGSITAKKIIVATHFPFINSHGFYFTKMYQHRSYAIAIKGAPQIDGMYVDEKQNGMSFRNYKDLMLAGGGDHRTGKQGGNYKELQEFIAKNYPESKEKYLWATQDCITLDNIPYIGNYSKFAPNLYVATGFNKWGMTSSMVAATILTDIILEIKNDFSDVFSPDRPALKPQLFINLGETLINFFTPTVKRCSHLGCALKWNKAEHTWDCPCHGSRFEKDGDLIDNPAMKRANVE
ncbi:MAG: Cytochrome b6-f complex iron-sulfur subunit [Eubacteriales bacterium SKADARSKE-1]|nr:Cytochrome b6-f complex iron-sulfur subunit [Eubacteriales bacterium SKADARSKE-1]